MVKCCKHAAIQRYETASDSEEEMRRALFGSSEVSASATPMKAQETVPEIVIAPVIKGIPKKNAAKAFTPRMRVTLKVGNIFEGEAHEITPEADMLTTLLAEQEAV